MTTGAPQITFQFRARRCRASEKPGAMAGKSHPCEPMHFRCRRPRYLRRERPKHWSWVARASSSFMSPPRRRRSLPACGSILIRIVIARNEPGRQRHAVDIEGHAALPSREILLQGGSDLLQRPVDLIAGDHKWRGDADRVLMGVLRKDASALQCLAVATCAACFRVKLDRQH
jgi:hypothetical protein